MDLLLLTRLGRFSPQPYIKIETLCLNLRQSESYARLEFMQLSTSLTSQYGATLRTKCIYIHRRIIFTCKLESKVRFSYQAV